MECSELMLSETGGQLRATGLIRLPRASIDSAAGYRKVTKWLHRVGRRPLSKPQSEINLWLPLVDALRTTLPTPPPELVQTIRSQRTAQFQLPSNWVREPVVLQ